MAGFLGCTIAQKVSTPCTYSLGLHSLNAFAGTCVLSLRVDSHSKVPAELKWLSQQNSASDNIGETDVSMCI